MSKGIRLVAASTYLAMASTASLAADTINFGEEKFEVSAGIFLQYFDTNIKVEDIDTGIGEEINLEDVLGYKDDDASAYFNAAWRFFPKHRIGVSYFESAREVDAVALEDIDFGNGDVIPAGAFYGSEFNVKVVPIEYTYSFINNDSQELYGTIGLHWHSIDYSVLAAAGIGEEIFDGDIDVTADAPMPLIGGGWDYYLNERWKMTLGAQAFYIKLSEDAFSFEGSIINASIATEYYIWNNVGIGASLSYFKLDVDIDDDEWAGSMDYSYWGPAAYVKVRF